MRSILIVAAAAAAVSPNCATAQRFDQGASQTAVVGDSVPLSISGLPPGERVEVVSERNLEWPEGGRQSARAAFTADARGVVDLSTSRPISGTYAQADGSGLFWSMAPNFPFAFGAKANEFRITAFVNSRPAARTKVVFVPTTTQVTETPVAGFPGAFLVQPTGTRRLPVVIVLGGGEGNDYLARSVAARFAGRGFAVLGLPMYSPRSSFDPKGRFPELPGAYEELPVERLDTAYAWLRTQPHVDPGRVGLYGHSRGAELALLAATRFKWIRAVAAIAPTDVVNVGWGGEGSPRSPYTLRGRPVPFVPAPELPRVLGRLDAGLTGETMRDAYERGRRTHLEAVKAARIPVERFSGPLLVAGAGQDEDWPSAGAAQAIAEARAAHGKQTDLLIYDRAGHGLSQSGWEPPSSGLGGTPAANAEAQQSLWAATFRFMAESLR